jgi:hypothetical protein
MLKTLLFYGLIVGLIALLVFPYFLQYILTLVLRKFKFTIKITGFWQFQNVSMLIQKWNSPIASVFLTLKEMRVRKVPKEFKFRICLKGLVLKLGYHSIDLRTSANLDAQSTKTAGNVNDNTILIDNSAELLRIMRMLYEKNEPLLKKASTLKAARSVNDNLEFFKLIILKFISIIFIKLIIVESSDMIVEFNELNRKDAKREEETTLKLAIDRFTVNYQYLKVK